VLVYAVGGPGGSGLVSADDYLAAFDPSLTENMDVVFFDQRGVGPVHGIECPIAQGIFDRADMALARPDAAVAAAKTYVTDCMAEMKGPDLLRVVDTEQAIRDVEMFRKAIGGPKIWVFGESYGTQFVQQYATAFPDAVSGVVVDGVVDLNLSFPAYYVAYNQAAEKILARVLAECSVMADCASDMKGTAVEAYDTLAAVLAQGPVEVDFPLAGGGTARRKLTDASLETDAFYALYGPDGRATFLRALAAASHGEYLPMLRLEYSNLYIDPETDQGIADPGWFGAAYYAITCADYGDDPDGGPALLDRILNDAKDYAKTSPRLIRSYYAERLVCAFWPTRGPATRPEPFAGGEYPTLILNSDTDPITPVTMSYSVFDNVQNGSLVVMQGGPHVIWGRGLACPDRIVQDLMFNGTPPEAPFQLCQQPFVEGYVPLTLRDAAGAADALTLARAVETEMKAYPEYSGWDGTDGVAFGCDFGGGVTATATDTGTDFTFSSCAFWPGLVVDGAGTELALEEGTDGLTLALAVSGSHQGQITYHNNTETEAWTIRGSYDGADVATPRPIP
jgi:pimeloyl-ACP methyl ester carboxylesterase